MNAFEVFTTSAGMQINLYKSEIVITSIEAEIK